VSGEQLSKVQRSGRWPRALPRAKVITSLGYLVEWFTQQTPRHHAGRTSRTLHLADRVVVGKHTLTLTI
jgi:hypothetical protein